MAFCEEMARPSGVTAPVDFAELARDASRPATVTGLRDLAPLRREAAMRRMELIFGPLRFPFLSAQNGAFALCAFLFVSFRCRLSPSLWQTGWRFLCTTA